MMVAGRLTCSAKTSVLHTRLSSVMLLSALGPGLPNDRTVLISDRMMGCSSMLLKRSINFDHLSRLGDTDLREERTANEQHVFGKDVD